jgi:hypothetical protein
VLQNILRYGYVSIQTAGEAPNLSLKNIKKPQEINNFIMRLKDKYTTEKMIQKKNSLN